MRWKLTTLMVFFATLGLSVYLFVIIPKGFFPQQDNGLITATSEASQDISFADEAAPGRTRQDRAGRPGCRLGRDGDRRQRRAQYRRMFITLKPRGERKASAQQIIARLRPQAGEGRGRPAVHAGGAGRRLGGPAHPVRVHAAGCRPRRAERMGAKILAKMQTLPELRDVATDQQTKGTTLELKINRDTAARYGIRRN